MTRIAYLLHQSGLGSELALVRLLSVLDRDRFDPVVVLPQEGPLRGAIKELGISVRIMPLAWWIPATHWDAGRFASQLEGLCERANGVAALLQAERVRLVHTNSIVTLEGALAAASLGLPHVWYSRGLFGNGFPPNYMGDTTFFLTAADSLADTLVCVSRNVEQQMARVCWRAIRAVVYDGFDFEQFLSQSVAEAELIRKRLGIEQSARVVACIGGIQRRKGQLDVVEAAPALVREFPGLIFVFAGAETDAEYATALDARIGALGLKANFQRVGFEPKIRDLLSIAEVLVHPSHSEGFGLAILEAMAAGVPVLATQCGGPEEIVQDGLSGLLVPPGNPPALLQALRRLLSDPVMARQLGRAGSARAAEFSLAKMAGKTHEIYSKLLAGPATAGRAQIAESVANEVLSRARRAATIDPAIARPCSLHSPLSDNWLSRLQKRFAGWIP